MHLFMEQMHRSLLLFTFRTVAQKRTMPLDLDLALFTIQPLHRHTGTGDLLSLFNVPQSDNGGTVCPIVECYEYAGLT